MRRSYRAVSPILPIVVNDRTGDRDRDAISHVHQAGNRDTAPHAPSDTCGPAATSDSSQYH